MKSDLVHSIVQTGPQVQWPKANPETAGAKEPNLEKAMKRTLLEPSILKNWMTEVKETVATDVAVNRTSNKQSLNLNLWAMRRNGRYASNARRKPGIITGLGY
jgi:hypothetical protein